MKPGRRQEPHQLYRLYDSEGALLYIGVTVDLKRRLSQHRYVPKYLTNPIFNIGRRLDHWTSEMHPDRATALAAEAVAIRAECPEFNTNHRSAA